MSWGTVGCAWVQAQPLPTVQPVAVLPVTPPATQPGVRSIPPTFTPVMPQVGVSESDAVAAVPTSIESVPLPPQTPQPTANVVQVSPQFLQNLPVSAFDFDLPPPAIDCSEHGLLFRSRFPSEVGGPWRDYHGYLPPCYGEDGRSYPTLYLFHGSIQNDTHWIDLGLIEHVEKGIREGRYPPFIMIMPDNGEIGNNTSGNDHSIEGITVNALIPYVDEQFCTWDDAAGRGIGGISRGGYWALMIAFRHEALFTAVSGHSSHLRYETDRAEYNPLSTYADADLSNMRIWLDWGETDFLRTGQMQLRDALQEIGADLEVHVNDGGHNDAYWSVHLQEYIDWHVAQWPPSRRAYPPCRE
ncbi:MAG: hypothetical protein KC419_15930, partial [Anaerolineales bacterium]|nr:hypothetical protein [Anaerolineales bacterium]